MKKHVFIVCATTAGLLLATGAVLADSNYGNARAAIQL